MKYILFLFTLFFTMNLYSQSELKETNQMKSLNVSKQVDADGKKYHVENKRQYVSAGNKKYNEERTVEYYDAYIESIEVKIDIIRNDEIENKKALESGWYDQMDKYIAKAKGEREKLIASKQTTQEK